MRAATISAKEMIKIFAKSKSSTYLDPITISALLRLPWRSHTKKRKMGFSVAVFRSPLSARTKNVENERKTT